MGMAFCRVILSLIGIVPPHLEWPTNHANSRGRTIRRHKLALGLVAYLELPFGIGIFDILEHLYLHGSSVYTSLHCVSAQEVAEVAEAEVSPHRALAA